MQKIKYTSIILSAVFAVGACGAQETEPSNAATEPAAEAVKEAPPAPCQDPEFRQLDFWVGEWDLSWTQQDGTLGQGTNIITRAPYGDCVIMENFDGSPTLPFKGMSVSTYSILVKEWRQTWVDDQGGYFSLHGGPQEDGTFILEMDRYDDKVPYLRMVWEDITEDSLVWRWQGKADADADWADRWVLNYKRKGS